ARSTLGKGGGKSQCRGKLSVPLFPEGDLEYNAAPQKGWRAHGSETTAADSAGTRLAHGHARGREVSGGALPRVAKRAAVYVAPPARRRLAHDRRPPHAYELAAALAEGCW